MRIDKEHTACLVIDIQEKIFRVMAGKEEFLKNCTTLIRGMIILEIPVLVTQQYTKGLGDTIPEIRICIPDFHYTEKRKFSCCDEPSVMQHLYASGIENVILCGIESHVCVLQTAVDLKGAGMHPIVVMDAVTSRTENSAGLARERFRHQGIMMTSAESILFELTRSSAAPEFREISKLVK